MRISWQLATEDNKQATDAEDRDLAVVNKIDGFIKSIDVFVKEHEEQVNLVTEILSDPPTNYSHNIEKILISLNNTITNENDLSIADKAKFILLCVYCFSQSSNKSLVNFLELSRHSWLLSSYWVETAVKLSSSNKQFKNFLIDTSYSKLEEYSSKVEGEGYFEELSLTSIWFNHFREETKTESWKWSELLVKLNEDKFFKLFYSLTNPVVVNDILSAPVFYNNFKLWSSLTVKAPEAFDNESKWNSSIVLPLLLVNSYSYILHNTSKTPNEEKTDKKIAATTSLLNDCVAVISQRTDFYQVFKRWGAFITRNYILNDQDRRKFSYFDPQELLLIMLKTIKDKDVLIEVPADVEPWEPWVYRCMLFILVKENNPFNLSYLPVKPFVDEWSFGYSNNNKWLSEQGLSLLEKSQLFKKSEPNQLPVRFLAAAICKASPNNIADNWKKMWEGNLPVRQALDLYLEPPERFSKLKIYEAENISCLLLDLGLSMIDYLVEPTQELSENNLLDINNLFEALWNACFELLSLSIFSEDFIQKLQWHLVLRRALWCKDSQSGDKKEFYSKINSAISLSHSSLLQELLYNPPALITLLPLYKQNGIELSFVSNELKEAGISLEQLKCIASKYNEASFRKFKVTQSHLDLIDNLLNDY